MGAETRLINLIKTVINSESYIRFKDLPNFQSMFGNIGNSWNNPLPNDLYIKGVPKNVFRLTNFVGNVGTGLDTLLSFIFPAKSLKLNELDHFRCTLAGGFLNNDDNKRIQVSFGGNILYNSGLADLDDFGFWLDFIIFRLSNTNFNFGMQVSEGQVVADSTPTLFSPGGIYSARNGNILTLSGGSTFNGNAQTLLLEAESSTATNNNIIVNIASVELIRF